jgi:streptogramin lyase
MPSCAPSNGKTNMSPIESFPSDKPNVAVRQLNGRAGEVWGAESATDRLVVIRATNKGVN